MGLLQCWDYVFKSRESQISEILRDSQHEHSDKDQLSKPWENSSRVERLPANSNFTLLYALCEQEANFQNYPTQSFMKNTWKVHNLYALLCTLLWDMQVYSD